MFINWYQNLEKGQDIGRKMYVKMSLVIRTLLLLLCCEINRDSDCDDQADCKQPQQQFLLHIPSRH